jgi:glycosyltransferase involved in cell wall biosynthesis
LLSSLGPKAHGGSFARNCGAAEANAPYLCSLDDDDIWIDSNHLSRAQAVITEARVPVDIYMTNQAAFLHDKPQPGPIWIEDLPPILASLGNRPDRHEAYTVTVEELLRSQGFCHLNTLIVRRALYDDGTLRVRATPISAPFTRSRHFLQSAYRHPRLRPPAQGIYAEADCRIACRYGPAR